MENIYEGDLIAEAGAYNSDRYAAFFAAQEGK